MATRKPRAITRPLLASADEQQKERDTVMVEVLAVLSMLAEIATLYLTWKQGRQ
jgi:hypothetical protein